MSSVKTHIEKPEPQGEVRYYCQFLFTQSAVFTICIQKNGIGVIGRFLCHSAGIYIQGKVLPKGRNIIHQPAITHKIKVENGNRIIFKLEVLREQIKLAATF